jgi:hypothetical protein
MKAKLSFALAVFALSLAVQPEPDQPVAAAPDKCASFCAIVSCIPYQTCGLYINSSGQTVCGCHGDSIGF